MRHIVIHSIQSYQYIIVTLLCECEVCEYSVVRLQPLAILTADPSHIQLLIADRAAEPGVGPGGTAGRVAPPCGAERLYVTVYVRALQAPQLERACCRVWVAKGDSAILLLLPLPQQLPPLPTQG